MTDLKDDIAKLRAQVAANDLEREKKRYNSRSEQVKEDARFFWRFYLQFVAAAIWIWWHILHPMTNWAVRLALWVFGLYRKAWSFLVYKRDKYGDLKFSVIRAAVFLVLFVPVTLFTAHLTFDGAVYGVTQRHNEKVYLFQATDNSSDNSDEFSITGCEIPSAPKESGFQCDSEDTIYFRVKPGLVEHIYALFTKRDIFYSENVAAVVAPGWNECIVDSWYIRFKFLMRNTPIFPKLLDASCRPLSVGR